LVVSDIFGLAGQSELVVMSDTADNLPEPIGWHRIRLVARENALTYEVKPSWHGHSISLYMSGQNRSCIRISFQPTGFRHTAVMGMRGA
jgi:hypothetical protein